MATLEREIDRLYELQLDEFTPGRNELARRLKQAGDKEAAEVVQTLAKPSVPAWAINQLARQEKAKVKALLAAGTKLRKAQERALAGGHAETLRAAQAEERQAVRELTRRAEEILKESGRPATRAIIERISSTLGAAAVTEPARTALKAGRLTSEVKVSGFDAIAGLELPAQPSARPDELAERRERKSTRERKRRQLEKKARELEARAEAAEEEAEQAEEAAAEARAAAEERRRAADAAASELAELEESS